MARTPSLTPQQAEAAIGFPRGKLGYIGSMDMHATMRKWLTANGVPGFYAEKMQRGIMVKVYNDTTDSLLSQTIQLAKLEASQPSAPELESGIQAIVQQEVKPMSAANTNQQAQIDKIATLLGTLLTSPQIDRAQVESIVDDKLSGFNLDKATIESMVRDLIPVSRIETVIDGATHTIEGVHHYKLPLVMACVMANIPVLLVGPAGSGKSTAAEQVANALKTDLYLKGAASGSHEYIGFIDGGGKYHTTEWRQAYEHGGVFCGEELDVGSPDVPLVLNSGVANGHMSFPDSPQPIKRHDGFRLIANANTYGTGPDRVYVGRTQLDGATIDRFAVIEWEYDESMEMAIAGGNGGLKRKAPYKLGESKPIETVATEWVARVQTLRANAAKQKARLIISPRASIFGAKLLAMGVDQETVEEIVVFKGQVDADAKRRISQGY